MAFLASLVLAVIAGLINMVVFIVHKSQDDVNQTVVIVAVATVGGVLGVPLVAFCLFHAFLAVTGSTTRECIKKIDQVPADSQNQWCAVDDSLFDPFIELSEQEAHFLTAELQHMRRPMVEHFGTVKTTKEMM